MKLHALFQTMAPTFIVWSIYCGFVGLVFLLLKIFSYRLHHMFDTCEIIEEVKDKKEDLNAPADNK